MKIHLASIMEPHNFAQNGRLIGIIHGRKPFKLKVDWHLPQITPSVEILESYKKDKEIDPSSAGKTFVKSYRQQLDRFFSEVKSESQRTGKSVMEILPFQENDTLISWERGHNNNYRKVLAEYLKDLGFEVLVN